MSNPISIPNDAPFTPEQRAWLGTFLSKLLSATNAPAEQGPAIPATILYGSQTGNAEGLAKKLAKILTKRNFATTVTGLDQYELSKLPNEKNVFLISSTYGDGEPPDNAADFYNAILSDSAPRLDGVSYTILALGDSSYPDFCKCGIVLDEKFAELGASRITPRIDVDVDFDEPFKLWSNAILAILATSQAPGKAQVSELESETGFTKQNPYAAQVRQNYNLNQDNDKQTNHVALALGDSQLTYDVGDALGVYPRNDEAIVDEIIKHLPFKAGVVTLPDDQEISLRDALLEHYDIGTLNKSIVQKWQARSGSPFLRSLVQADDRAAWDAFCWGRDVIDLVIDHPADFSDSDEFVSVLKKLQPRLYSIASSPKAHPGEVHLCVGVVRYQSYGRKRGGICSTFLADRLKGHAPRIFVHHNPAFRLPTDGATDVIMVGPGTGIAPFRAFLEERQATNATGRNWLLFGNPHEKSDFLYREELENFAKNGLRLDLAWSRDQAEKVYVQHAMLKQGADLWAWLDKGASFYVCGDATRMAKDVEAALLQIAREHGSLSEDAATEWISQLKKQKRYLRDVY